MSTQGKLNKITTAVIKDMKKKKEKVNILTAYDY